MKIWNRIAAVMLVAIVSAGGRAEVVRVEIEARAAVRDGRPFGEGGSYEKLTGRIFFALDPDNPMNAAIVDLKRAPRNEEGRVEAWADLMVLRPVPPSKRSPLALVEVSNRGRKASLSYFNRARRALDPVEPEHFGDGLLMRQGLTIIWIGWQCDVPDSDGLLRLRAPVATENGQSISGLARSDWTVDEARTTLALGHRGHIAYPVSDPDDPANVLTVRAGRLAPRAAVPRSQWRFARATDTNGGGVVDDPTHIYKESEFDAGRIYELVYRTQDPRVVGFGLAAIRDVMSYARYDEACPFPVEKGIAFGVSQTGRFLRHFLYQGFNTDERGRPVFDGMLIHTAGAGRGSFNHRFAQPSRDAHRYSAFFYPTDIFPFTSRPQMDAGLGVEDGLSAHEHVEGHWPRVFYTNTGYEYWGRAASLIHTTPDGAADVEPLPSERIYHLASGQHFVSRYPPAPGSRLGAFEAYRGNPLDFLLPLRALLLDLLEWVRDDIEPPPSAYPRVETLTLVSLDALRFPEIPGVAAPSVVHEAYRADYGPRWYEGVVEHQPPHLGKPFVTLVPQVDDVGNERGGVRTVEIMAPLATYAPWNLRTSAPAARDELTDFYGTFIPLARTERQRQASGDPRPSIELLYASEEAYRLAVQAACQALVARRFLLREDVDRAIDRAKVQWDDVAAEPSPEDP